ncbi:YdeI/OmpD-associated family protein [Nocardia bhagyanarayanae]|uniref:YdeI/OmpD-associated family protein n=1 Tax=Nocardia bhagyanarayanae TaxID=1215925 RepID=UPI00114FD5DD
MGGPPVPRDVEGDPRAARQNPRRHRRGHRAPRHRRRSRCPRTSRRRQLVGAIESAERPETRAKRIGAVVAAAG